jgi:hypothetical protein
MGLKTRTYCPNCKQETEFYYLGRQEGIEGVEEFDLWDCQRCSSSLANSSLGLKLLSEQDFKKFRNQNKR